MSTTTKISRSRSGHVWVTVRSVAMPDLVRRELFSDLLQARREAKVMVSDVELQAEAEQKRLNAVAEKRGSYQCDDDADRDERRYAEA